MRVRRHDEGRFGRRDFLATLVVVAAATLGGCSNSSFSGSGGKTGAAKDDGPNDDDDGDANVDLGGTATGTSTNTTDNGVNVLGSGEVRETFQGPTAAVTAKPVDVVFAVDTSGSMGEEKATLEQKMALFISQLEAGSAGLDFHIYAIGDRFNFPAAAAGRLTRVEQRVSSHDALEILQRYFSGGIAGAPQPRPEALKAVVVITDDEAEDVGAAAFKSFVASSPSLNGKFSFNGLVGLPTSAENDWCGIAGIGYEYITLGQDPAFGKPMKDLCSQNWDQLLTEIAAGIISDVGVATFRLSRAADLSRPLSVTVNGSPLAAGTYTIDPLTNALTFGAGAVVPAGAQIVVTYFPR